MPLIQPRRRIMRPPRAPFAFPGTPSRFDPSHLASAGMRPGYGFSGVALTNNFVSLLTGAAGVLSGGFATVAKVDGIIGPGVLRSGTSDQSAFAGNSTAAQTSMTYAAIFNIVSLGSDLAIISATDGGGNGSGVLYVSAAGGLLSAYSAVGSYGTGIALSTGVPYFVALSHSPSASNQIVVRLDTGQMLTSTPTSSLNSTPPSNSGTILVLSDQFGRSATANIAAAMLSFNYTSMATLQSWAASPWEFWYPRK